MRIQILEFLAISGIGGSIFALMSKVFMKIDFIDVITITGTLLGIYFAWRGLENERIKREEEKLSERLQDIRDDFSAELRELRSIVTLSLDQNKELLRTSLEKIGTIFAELKAHTGHYYGHEGIVSEISVLKESLDKLRHNISTRSPNDEILQQIRELGRQVAELRSDK